MSNAIDAGEFALALRSGIYRVIAGQADLNRINVFPVADGDTGTNLSLTLGAALPTLTDPRQEHVGLLLAAVADALLDGARGNSGAIMAQFFQGMSDTAADLTHFSPDSFAHAVAAGCEYARDALSDPQDGTILSVIAAFARELDHPASASSDQGLLAVLPDAVASASRALEETERQLEVLRKAGVVDAGAKGFVELARGMADYLVHGIVTDAPGAPCRPRCAWIYRDCGCGHGARLPFLHRVPGAGQGDRSTEAARGA
jgi:uncharacterized protein